jgi:hypothetical protein
VCHIWCCHSLPRSLQSTLSAWIHIEWSVHKTANRNMFIKHCRPCNSSSSIVVVLIASTPFSFPLPFHQIQQLIYIYIHLYLEAVMTAFFVHSHPRASYCERSLNVTSIMSSSSSSSATHYLISSTHIQFSTAFYLLVFIYAYAYTIWYDTIRCDIIYYNYYILLCSTLCTVYMICLNAHR